MCSVVAKLRLYNLERGLCFPINFLKLVVFNNINSERKKGKTSVYNCSESQLLH